MENYLSFQYLDKVAQFMIGKVYCAQTPGHWTASDNKHFVERVIFPRDVVGPSFAVLFHRGPGYDKIKYENGRGEDFDIELSAWKVVELPQGRVEGDILVSRGGLSYSAFRSLSRWK